MGFKEIVRDMVENGGGIAGTVMGRDGIAIQNYIKEDGPYDVETLGVEFGNVLGEILKVAEILRLGEMEEVTIRTAENTVLLRLINPEYFAIVVLGREGRYGKARYVLKRSADEVRKEL